jgi:hypothetical protein
MPDTPERSDGDIGPANLLEVDFALVVSRLIDAAKNDPAQLRSSVYELARLKLLDQVSDENRYEQGRMIESLETAIRGVEIFSRREETAGPIALLGVSRDGSASRELTVGGAQLEGASDVADRLSSRDRSLRSPLPTALSRSVGAPDIVQMNVAPARRLSPLMRSALIVGVIAVLAMSGIYIKRHVDGAKVVSLVAGRWPANDQASQAAVHPPGPERGGSPQETRSPLLPKTFGVYAISADQLFELEMLQGRVPDARVAVSAAFNSPSHTTLPNGKVRFIVYRRDSFANAPDRVEIRVIAKVVSAMTFASTGKPTVAPTEDSWVIRNVSFGYRVGPVKEDAAMYEIRGDNDDAVLAPGRYALVIKGSAYDFTVAGKVVDQNHCLERIEASNGSFYSPCQKP